MNFCREHCFIIFIFNIIISFVIAITIIANYFHENFCASSFSSCTLVPCPREILIDSNISLHIKRKKFIFCLGPLVSKMLTYGNLGNLSFRSSTRYSVVIQRCDINLHFHFGHELSLQTLASRLQWFEPLLQYAQFSGMSQSITLKSIIAPGRLCIPQNFGQPRPNSEVQSCLISLDLFIPTTWRNSL